MKKTFLSILSVVIAVAMTGCASSGAASSNTAASGSSSTTMSSIASESEVSGNSATSGETFRLGLICPLSGSSAVSGKILENAVKMAIEEINKAGGINGNIPIELFEVDDEAVPATSVTAMQKLVQQDKVNAVIGSQPSSCTLANMEITEAAEIPQITPASSNVAITKTGNKFIFQMTATDELHMRNIMKYEQDQGNSKFAILYESSDFGTGGYKIASSLAESFGQTMVDHEVYNSGDTDFSVSLQKMADAEPDYFIFWGYHTEVAMICNQMKEYGIEYPAIGQGFNSPELTNLGGSAVNGLMISTAFDAANQDEKVQAFDKKYVSQFGGSYDQNAPQSYDAVYVISDAVTRCIADGKDWADGATLTGYISSTNYEGVTGTTTFDENGAMNKELLLIQIEDGKHVIVEK